jgi:Rrf2 family protein
VVGKACRVKPEREDPAVRITARVDYAVRAMVELARAPAGVPVKGDAVAATQAIPWKFAEGLLADLRKAGLVASSRGAAGGYWLSRPGRDITVADVIRAVEGPLADVRGAAPEELPELGPSPAVRELWVATRAALREVLEATSVQDLADGTLPAAVAERLRTPGAWARRDDGTAG